MSLESNVGRAVLDLGEIIKSSVVGTVARSRSEGKFTLSDSDLTVVANIIADSIDATVMNGVDMVVKLVKK